MSRGVARRSLVLTVDFPLQYPAIKDRVMSQNQRTYPMFGPVREDKII